MCSETRSSTSSAKPAAPGASKTELLPRRPSVSSPLSTDLPPRTQGVAQRKGDASCPEQPMPTSEAWRQPY